MAERIKDYECCTLFQPELDAEQLDSEVAAVENLIRERGGELQRTDRWAKRFLAYPIKSHAEGYYVIFRWYSSRELLPDLDYLLKYNDNVLRHLVLDYTEKERKRRKRLGKDETA